MVARPGWPGAPENSAVWLRRSCRRPGRAISRAISRPAAPRAAAFDAPVAGLPPLSREPRSIIVVANPDALLLDPVVAIAIFEVVAPAAMTFLVFLVAGLLVLILVFILIFDMVGVVVVVMLAAGLETVVLVLLLLPLLLLLIAVAIVVDVGRLFGILVVGVVVIMRSATPPPPPPWANAPPPSANPPSASAVAATETISMVLMVILVSPCWSPVAADASGLILGGGPEFDQGMERCSRPGIPPTAWRASMFRMPSTAVRSSARIREGGSASRP